MSHDVTFDLIPNRIGFCHGHILIGTAMYSSDYRTRLASGLRYSRWEISVSVIVGCEKSVGGWAFFSS